MVAKERGSRKKRRPSRLKPADWLAHALEELKLKGPEGIRVRSLARTLGVTLGSFYWHFKDLTEFKLRLLEYWRVEITEKTIARAISGIDDPREQLASVAAVIFEAQASRYEAAIRAWASYETAANKVVREVDRIRMEFLRVTFGRLGFAGEELETRARLFLCFELANPLIVTGTGPDLQQSISTFRVRLLTSPTWPLQGRSPGAG